MTITMNQNGAQLDIALEGRLDTQSSPELEKKLDAVELSGISRITIDLSGLEYISSAGLRVLFHAFRGMKQGGEMKLQNANEIVRKVFEITGFDSILTLE